MRNHVLSMAARPCATVCARHPLGADAERIEATGASLPMTG